MRCESDVPCQYNDSMKTSNEFILMSLLIDRRIRIAQVFKESKYHSEISRHSLQSLFISWKEFIDITMIR